MKTRRELLIATSAGLCIFAGPLAAFAQPQGNLRRVGFLYFASRQSALESGRYELFRQSMREHGYVEGRNYELVARFADGLTERLPGLVEELARLKVDAIVATGTPVAAALKHAGGATPVVMTVGADPVGEGYAATLAQPGGRFTGLATGNAELFAKHVELLKIALPKLSRVAILWNSANESHPARLKQVLVIAQKAGLKAVQVGARGRVRRRHLARVRGHPVGGRGLPDQDGDPERRRGLRAGSLGTDEELEEQGRREALPRLDAVARRRRAVRRPRMTAAALARSFAVGGAARPLASAVLGIAVALGTAALLVLLSGRNPVVAYLALLGGAVGTPDRVAVALNKATPYLLTGAGVALCFRARIVNIGAEGQIALGGLAATWLALRLPQAPAVVLPVLCALAGAGAGAVWGGLAALVRLKRRVHEVLVTLLLNFVGVLIVGEVLHGELGEPGAGFPQSPLLPAAGWLPRLVRGTDLHVGILVAVAAVVACHLVLWRTPFGFRLRVLGASEGAARYAGIGAARATLSVMMLAGALAGVAGAIEVLGVHYRLIEGFSQGFGFAAVSIALIGGLSPLGVLPAGLFFGFLESGALAMQRAVGVPTPLVSVIQGLTMIFVLAAMALSAARARV